MVTSLPPMQQSSSLLPSSPSPTLAAGQPLDTSQATIRVLTTDDATPIPPTLPTSHTDVTVLEAQPTHTFATESTPTTPISPTINPTLTLGITLNLLQTAILQGSPQAQSLAQTTLRNAQTVSNTALTEALTSLTSTLPPQGAPTLPTLLAQAANLPQPEAFIPPPQPIPNQAPSWMSSFISLRSITTQPTPSTPINIPSVQHSILQGSLPQALTTLSQPPYASMPQAQALATSLQTYLSIQHALNQTLAAYQTLLNETAP
ncbi:MAG: hypothetical protein WAZ18_04300 [Alphaproteobacteria bacterium]